ncbi:MAG TPA: MFS transporter [Cytophagaceae bacterium]|jgi:NNP family nitrate/nitrite transporter-like MFS transporter|nr:MFS transporter [Cytophagaceae bacterium]
MKSTQKAEKLDLFSFKTPQMRAFHLTWMTFFLCFFGWFGIAPLMPIIREELHLTKGQIGNIMIASIAMTIFARLLVGWICDKIGPRITYSVLLLVGSFPVMMIGLSNSYESFLIFRLAIGVIGAAFVITQYHTSVMFAPNIVGTANATAAGWGNLGGGITQMIMPLIFVGFVSLGFVNADAWRYSMIVPGFALLIMSAVYYFYTQDFPQGNLSDLKKDPSFSIEKKKSTGNFKEVISDYRVWVLFLVYGCSFGIEITIDNIAALYFKDKFSLSLATAGLIAGLFGSMNIFARALGGIASDKVNKKYGLKGRAFILGAFLFMEGLGIILFSQTTLLVWAVSLMILFALFVKMSNGATFSVVPFINQKSLGIVSGIVGAGGNVGAVFAGFVFKSESLSYDEGFFYIGMVVCLISILAFFIKFPFVKQVEEKNYFVENKEKETIEETELVVQ